MGNIGNIIKERRKELKLSLKDIANKLNVSESLISRYENGDITNIPVDNIESLAKIYNVTPAYIMGWETERKKKLGDNINNKRKLYSDEDNYREIIKKLNNFSNDELSKIRRIIEVIFEDK